MVERWIGAAPTYDFRGQTAVVTGAAHGIGRRIAERFAVGGATVVVADHHGDSAAQTADEITAAGGGSASAFAVDVTDAGQVDELIAFADGLGDTLRILVNNAGTATTKIVEETDVEDWRRVIDVNLNGPFITSRAIMPVLRHNGGGKIVNVASIAAKRISSNLAASYTASKAGLVAFTRHLAYEAACDGVNVNAVCPGVVESPMLYREVSAEGIAARKALIPAGRISSTDDQADAVLYLCSAAAAMVNGVALDVDGGSLLGWFDVATYFKRRGAQRTLSDRSF